MKKTTVFTFFTLVILIPTTLLLGTKLQGKWYYLIITLIILESMLPFFFSFEAKKPQARELVMIAVMAALAAISRSAFAFLPHFKPITAIIIISGIAFGAQAGFLTGALAAFASNFIFGQGFWTPWQMFAYGFGGFLAGLIFHRKRITSSKAATVILPLFGFLSVLLLVGPLLDCSSLFIFATKLTSEYALSVFTVGLSANIMHSISCAVTLLLFGKPLLSKLTRLQIKYGMMQSKE